ncbi:MAG: hypothetical protein ACI4X9_05210 [Kiritimatiellia bacterium]
MKKALVALALFAAGIAAADVTSSNIVGYQKIPVVKGLSGVTPTFVAIGGGDIQLKDIIPSEGFQNSGNLQFFSSDGKVSFTAYYYYDADDAENAGWYDFDTDDYLGDTTIAAGSGFFAYSNAEATFTVAGEVKQGSTTVTLAKGLTWAGNGTVNSLKLKDIIPSEGFQNSGNLQFFTSAGKVSFTAYYYYDADDEENAGWYDFDTDDYLGDTEVPAGSAVFAYSNAEATLTLPAAVQQ